MPQEEKDKYRNWEEDVFSRAGSHELGAVKSHLGPAASVTNDRGNPRQARRSSDGLG
jgi:hypothetical protein